MHSTPTKPYVYYEEKFKFSDGVDSCDWPNIPFYAIFDSKTMNAGPLGTASANSMYYAAVHNLYEWSSDNSAELAAGWIVSADTPADLGAKIMSKDFFGRVVGMDSAGLNATVTAWNAACASGADTAFGRPANTLKPFTSGPYYAMELCEVKLNACGGPAHDKYNRTLGVDNNPIPRLYSAGEGSSLWGFLYYGGMGEALAMGRVAGAQAATLSSWT
jgi:hypothetical protein